MTGGNIAKAAALVREGESLCSSFLTDMKIVDRHGFDVLQHMRDDQLALTADEKKDLKEAIAVTTREKKEAEKNEKAEKREMYGGKPFRAFRGSEFQQQSMVGANNRPWASNPRRQGPAPVCLRQMLQLRKTRTPCAAMQERPSWTVRRASGLPINITRLWSCSFQSFVPGKMQGIPHVHGALRRNIAFWQAIGASQFVPSAATVSPFFPVFLKKRMFPNHNSAHKHAAFAIKELLTAGCIRPVSDGEVHVVSPLGVVEQRKLQVASDT